MPGEPGAFQGAAGGQNSEGVPQRGNRKILKSVLRGKYSRPEGLPSICFSVQVFRVPLPVSLGLLNGQGVWGDT